MKKVILFFALILSIFSSFAQENQTVDVSTQIKSTLTATKSLLIKIADSNIDINNLTLDDNLLIDEGVLSEDDVNEFRALILENGNYIKDNLGTENEECENCNITNDEKLNKLKNIILTIRENKELFIEQFDEFSSKVERDSKNVSKLFSSGPKCNFGFYVCIGVGSTASSGLLAAAAIYLCACNFCELHPPGC